MVSDLVAEKRATLFVITGREALRWAEIDDSWAEQPELGGLPIAEAERLLVEEGISDPLLRETMWTNASAPDGPEDREPVYPLLLDLQVQHWRNRQTIGREVESSALRVDARDFEGHRTETGWNTEDMFPGAEGNLRLTVAAGSLAILGWLHPSCVRDSCNDVSSSMTLF